MKTKYLSVTLATSYTKIDVPAGLKLIQFKNATAAAILVKVNNLGDALSIPVSAYYEKSAKESGVESIADEFYLSGSGTITVEYEY